MSNSEVLLNVPQNQELVSDEQSKVAEIVDRGRQLVGRLVLVLCLGAGSGAVAGIGETALNPESAEASATFVNTYPDMDAANRGENDWWKDENGNGIYTSGESNSSRLYGYRNCTDGVAYWVSQYTGVGLPGWGNAKEWAAGATADGYNVKPGTTYDIEPGDIAQSIDGSVGHVGFVIGVAKNAQGQVTEINVAELNHTDNSGTYNVYTYNTRNAESKIIRSTGKDWDNFIDVNGANTGLSNEVLSGGSNIIVLHDPIAFGNANDAPVTGDWSAAGNTNVGTWRSGTFYLRTVDGNYTPIVFGNASDTPLSGEWDGPGATQVGVWRNGTFYLHHSNGNDEPIAFGNATDKPVTGDWNGDGTTDIGVWRNGTFYLRTGPTSYDTVVFGNASDVPVTGDWNGDNRTDVGVWRNGTFYLRTGTTSYNTVPYGNATDKPTTGDWDGNGTTDTGVWRNGTFYFNN